MSEMPVHSCRPPLSSLPESYKAYNVGKEQAMSHALPIRRRDVYPFTTLVMINDQYPGDGCLQYLFTYSLPIHPGFT